MCVFYVSFSDVWDDNKSDDAQGELGSGFQQPNIKLEDEKQKQYNQTHKHEIQHNNLPNMVLYLETEGFKSCTSTY